MRSQPVRLSPLFALFAAAGLLPLAGCGDGRTVKVSPGGPGPGGAFQIDLSGVPTEAAKGEPEPDSVGVFFCLDVSGSMDQSVGGKKKIDISKEAMKQVFAQIAAYAAKNPSKKVKVGIGAFSDRVTIVQPMEPFDQAKLERAIEPLRPGGGTAIGDAMAVALRELIKAKAWNKAIIVMTDGENNQGAAPEDVVGAIAQGRNTLNAVTGDTLMFLVAFDVNAGVFGGVKQAGAAVSGARDQKSLEEMMNKVVEEALPLEKPG
jgi:uncharacterized protein YegL